MPADPVRCTDRPDDPPASPHLATVDELTAAANLLRSAGYAVVTQTQADFWSAASTEPDHAPFPPEHLDFYYPPDRVLDEAVTVESNEIWYAASGQSYLAERVLDVPPGSTVQIVLSGSAASAPTDSLAETIAAKAAEIEAAGFDFSSPYDELRGSAPTDEPEATPSEQRSDAVNLRVLAAGIAASKPLADGWPEKLRDIAGRLFERADVADERPAAAPGPEGSDQP